MYETTGDKEMFVERQPWPEAVNGEQLIEEIISVIRRYVAMGPHHATAVAFWILASHASCCFHIFPRLLIKSPEKGCGKSTLIDVIECLVNKPCAASHTTAAPLF